MKVPCGTQHVIHDPRSLPHIVAFYGVRDCFSFSHPMGLFVEMVSGGLRRKSRFLICRKKLIQGHCLCVPWKVGLSHPSQASCGLILDQNGSSGVSYKEFRHSMNAQVAGFRPSQRCLPRNILSILNPKLLSVRHAFPNRLGSWA